MAPIEPQAGRGAAGVEPPLTRFCVFCRQSVESWQPYPWVTGNSDFLDRLGVVGSNLERFFCPRCRSFDRERHLRLFLERRGIMEPLRGGAVLHLAPEPRLGEFIRSHGVSVYVQGDLSPRDASIQQMDAERLPFPPQAMDLVVCNHVLEHVVNPKRVLREILRVLKPGGRAICQTPYASRLTKTFEDPALQSAGDRIFFYGQVDHVRLFGIDIEQIVQAAGFLGRLVPHKEILPDVDPEALGIAEDEPFFDFVRPRSTGE